MFTSSYDFLNQEFKSGLIKLEESGITEAYECNCLFE
jgi:hypothetical protein